MDNQSEWKVVSKNRKGKKKNNGNFIKNKIVKVDKPENINNVVVNNKLENKNINIDIADKVILPCKYVLWCHDIFNKDWNLNAYTKLCTISTVSCFWKLFNNLDKIGYKTNNFFFMKEDTDPIWEHPNNRDGGICSFRSDIDSALKVYEDLCINMVCEKLFNNMDDINGISISPKNNWAIIKIWNKNKNNDLAELLQKDLKVKYNNLSIKYKANEPEF